MDNVYNRNGLLFWTQEEIRVRKMFEEHIVAAIYNNLKSQNRAFEFYQVEAPILTPTAYVNPQYSDEDMFLFVDDGLMLRPETTMGSYEYAIYLLESHQAKMPMCVWQHGKSFRREQDQVIKNMRLKEFYQLEFQIIYSHTTMNDYSVELIPEILYAISSLIGKCKIEPSDRVPSYAKWTEDVVYVNNDMELCSVSKRNDFDVDDDAYVLEVAIGTDRCVYNFMQKRKEN